MLFQQFVYLFAARQQAVELAVGQRRAEVFTPFAHGGAAVLIIGLEVFIVGGRHHIAVGQQEVVHLRLFAAESLLRRVQRAGGFGPPFFVVPHYVLAVVHLQPAAHHGVARTEAVAKKRGIHIFMDHVEPQAEFAQFDGRFVEVYAVDVVGRNGRLHLLPFFLEAAGVDAFAALPLPVFQVEFAHLVDHLVVESGRAHGGFQYLEAHQFARFHLPGVQALAEGFQGVVHHGLGQHFGGIVAGGFFAVAAVEAVHEGAGCVYQRAVQFGAFGVAFLEHLGVEVERVHAAARRQVGAFGGLVFLVYLNQFFGRQDAPVAEQAFVDAAELVDVEIGVADAPAAYLGPLHPSTRPGALAQGELLDDFLPHLIAYPHLAEVVQAPVVKERAIEPLHVEAAFIAFKKHAEEAAQAVVKKVTVQGVVAQQAGLFQVAQHLQAVAAFVVRVVQRQQFQFFAAFGVEEEEEAVDEVQAVFG